MNTFLSFFLLSNAVVFYAFGTDGMSALKAKKTVLPTLTAMIFLFTAITSPAVYAIKTVSAAYLPIVYVGSAALLYLLTLFAARHIGTKLFDAIRPAAHICAFNALSFGGAVVITGVAPDYPHLLLYALWWTLGFAAVGVLVLCAADNLNSEKIPPRFRGLPVLCFFLGAIALSAEFLSRGR
ncbi:MAG: hypothetical protein LBN42_04265 [Oscillospiraceae bacterium]|nr:hypothetical protein [Oscillospiraceae bacterium]